MKLPSLTRATESSEHGSSPAVFEKKAPDGSVAIVVQGNWTLRGLGRRVRLFQTQLKQLAGIDNRYWDMRNVDALDSAGALLLFQAWGGKRAPNLGIREEHIPLFERLEATRDQAIVIPKPSLSIADPIIAVGSLMLTFGKNLGQVIALLGQLVLDFLFLLRHPARTPWREISANVYRAGAQALMITALVGFLIGIVVSYLSSQQLENFGAGIFIVNILGISILRELGPLLAAILIAGRSGSSMTAQLGVMRVTQEIDALYAMGISPTLRLVLPKALALGLALPLIVLWTDAMAMLGGMTAAQVKLGIGPGNFLSSLPDAVPLANFWIGIGKGAVFGMLIALIACHFGLKIRPNTQSLGAGTTSSVVTSITVVIIVDAIFAVVFSGVGI